MPKYKYLEEKEKFLKYTYSALENQFDSLKDLEVFFSSIADDENKDLFLRTASFYLFLVKKGDWIVNIDGSDPIVDYLTETYKYIGIFALIESLEQSKFLDFYTYLKRRKSNIQFPIQDTGQLDRYYERYKKEFGSIQKSMRFFSSLDQVEHATLIEKLSVVGGQNSTESLSKYLYELRSKFVHEAKLVLNMS